MKPAAREAGRLPSPTSMQGLHRPDPSLANGLAPRLLARLRERAGAVRALTRSNSGLSLDYDNPPGDPGLFGPAALCWRVRGIFPPCWQAVSARC